MNLKDVIRMADEAELIWAGHMAGYEGIDSRDLMRFAKRVAAAEREACAKLVEADGLARGNAGLVLIKAAERIRARGEC